jgi:hypothetical protein
MALKYTEEEIKSWTLQQVRKFKQDKADEMTADELEMVHFIHLEKQKERKGKKSEPLDLEKLRILCQVQANQEEVCLALDIGVDSLRKKLIQQTGMTWQEFFNQHKSVGKISARKKLYSEAMRGNTTVLIFWAKNHLDMSDKTEQTQHVNIDPEDIKRISQELDDKY